MYTEQHSVIQHTTKVLRVNPGSHHHTFAFLLGLGPQRGIMYRLERGEKGLVRNLGLDYFFQKAHDCTILSCEDFYKIITNKRLTLHTCG